MRRTNGIQNLPLHEDEGGRRWNVALESSRKLYPISFIWALDLILPLR